MLFGHDSITVERKSGRNRDGDGVWENIGRIDGCSLQVQGLIGTEHTVRSNAQTMNATETDATLYLWHHEDVRKGDRIINSVDGARYQVNTDPIAHRYPSGTIAGFKCFLKIVEKW